MVSVKRRRQVCEPDILPGALHQLEGLVNVGTSWRVITTILSLAMSVLVLAS